MAIPAARQKTVIVGGSIAAVTAADSLRLQGYDGSIVLVSEESVPPYSRVPLSKGILAGSQDPATAYLPALPADIELRLGARARSLDVAGRLVTLDGGERLPLPARQVSWPSGPSAMRRPSRRGCGPAPAPLWWWARAFSAWRSPPAWCHRVSR